MSAATTITLPWPPSLNNMFIGKKRGGRVPTRRYTQWRREADLTVMAARTKPVPGRVKIALVLHPSCERNRDCDNFAKPILDCLVRMQIIADDGRAIVQGVSSEWGEKRKPAAAVVTITPVD